MSAWSCWTQGGMWPAENIFRWCKLNVGNSVTRRRCNGSLSDDVVFVKDCVVVSVAMVVTDIFQINRFSVRNKIGKIAKIFVKIDDPSVFGVLYLHRYFGYFTYFISHAKSIYLKNVGHDRGNTSCGCLAMYILDQQGILLGWLH
jgi:hypothetical protein